MKGPLLRLWEMAGDFGENVLITFEQYEAKYGDDLSKQNELCNRYNLPFERRKYGVAVYRGTRREAAKIMDNYIVAREMRVAYQQFPHDLEDIRAGLHRGVKCPDCKAEEELHCIKNGRIYLHATRLRLAQSRRARITNVELLAGLMQTR